jgi:hypothetical protein
LTGPRSPRSQPARAATATSATISNRIGRSYFDSLFVSLLGPGELEVVELLELDAGGDWGAIVTEVDEDAGG